MDSKCVIMSKKYIQSILASDIRNYYNLHSLNECLYLHFKGFRHIENIEEFTGLRSLYLEGNGLLEIQGLETLVQLRRLYLQQNFISKIEALHYLENLITLNLSDNNIQKIEGLSCCTQLQTLELENNLIGVDGVEDVIHLLDLQTLTTLILTNNRLEEENIIHDVIVKINHLAILDLSRNKVTKKIVNYRKFMVHKLRNLKRIDDFPIDKLEQRLSDAFITGGMEEEQEEHRRWLKEQETAHLINHFAFKKMAESFCKNTGVEKSETESQISVQSLSEYNSESVGTLQRCNSSESIE